MCVILYVNSDIMIKICIFPGNCIGDEGIQDLKSQLESEGKGDALASMSEDEGDASDEEEEELGDVENGEGESEGETSADLTLQVQGISLKPESPLLGSDQDVMSELQKVRLVLKFFFGFIAPFL